jgi:transcriptional regulator with XRE-family HTH domain
MTDRKNFIGNKISLYRKKKNLGQKELADLIGSTTSAIGGYEVGKSFPSIEVLYRLCVALDCLPNDLLLDLSQAERIADGAEHSRVLKQVQELEIRLALAERKEADARREADYQARMLVQQAETIDELRAIKQLLTRENERLSAELATLKAELEASTDRLGAKKNG